MARPGLLGQEPWELRGANDARLRTLETAVAAVNSRVVAGRTAITTDGSGRATISFPTAFAVAPVVTATISSGGTAGATWVNLIGAAGTSSFVVQINSSSGAVGAGGGYTISWVAVS